MSQQRQPQQHAPNPRSWQRTVSIALGTVLWLLAAFMVVSSVKTVYARLTRPVCKIYVDLPAKANLLTGDPVFGLTDRGLTRVGEVAGIVRGRATLAIQPADFAGMNASARAVTWRAPLSAEAAVKALLPSAVGSQAALQIASDWRAHEEELARVWQPLVADLATAYVEVLVGELRAACRRHEPELREIAQGHLQAIATQWPAIQQHMQPILQEHLTPVLGQMITHAITEAPKVEIAMLAARGKHGEAYERMLDWFVGYLAAIPDEDRIRLNEAVRKSWEAARDNPALAEAAESIIRPILEDRKLHAILADIYREAVADNPRTAQFVRSKIVEDPRIRAHAYAFLEAFAPTARTVVGLCLFDEQGATRPEIVHLVRSIALNRRVAWITLENTVAEGTPLPPGTVLKAQTGDREP